MDKQTLEKTDRDRLGDIVYGEGETESQVDIEWAEARSVAIKTLVGICQDEAAEMDFRLEAAKLLMSSW